MSLSIARTTARALAATVLTGAAVFGPAMVADTSALPQALAATKIDQAGITAILAKHNAARDEVKVGRLSWDDGLATNAQAYADKLAAQDSTSPAHDTAELDRLSQGENLAWSTGAPPLEFAVNFWYGEKAAYEAEPNKTTYTTPNAQKWGHYSQMVWSKTTKIGCGLAAGASGRNYVACRYSPRGNINGQLAYPGSGGGTGNGNGGGGVNPAACAYNPDGRGGYGSYVDGLALDQRDWEQDLANAINAYRKENGLPALQYSRTLARPAMWASLDAYNHGNAPANGVDSRGMDIPTRVKYCSGYTGYIGQVNYFSKDVAGAKWQRALEFWKSDPIGKRWLLDRQSKYFAVGMAYGGNDTDRVPAYYTVNFGDH